MHATDRKICERQDIYGDKYIQTQIIQHNKLILYNTHKTD